MNMTKFYKFDFDKGVPVSGGNMKWRSGVKTIPAFCLQNAVEKFAMPAFRQYGTDCKLNLIAAFVSPDKKAWEAINLDAVLISAYLIGCIKRLSQ